MLCALLSLSLLSVLATETEGQSVFLSLGQTNITTNNTEILITKIGENAPGGRLSLTCHTDLTACCRNGDTGGNGGRGEWRYPDGSLVLNNSNSSAAGQQFYIVRNTPQVIRLARREYASPLSPTGSYCCTLPTTEGVMTFCAILVVCQSLPAVLTNGMISYSDPTLGLNTVATYSCDSGYTLIGSSVRSCDSNGEWCTCGSAPICQAVITCPDLPPPSNGTISYSAGSTESRPFNTIATFKCDLGYAITNSASSTRTCQSDTSWSGLTPTCQLKMTEPPTESAAIICSDLTLTNGVILYSNRSTSSRPVGTVVTYICLNGYVPSSRVVSRTCLSNKTWSGEVITCLLPSVYVSLGSTSYAAMNAHVPIDNVGESNETALVCHTDSTMCCRDQDGFAAGEWINPDGNIVPREAESNDFVPIVSTQANAIIRLHHRGNVSIPTGSYCCVVPDKSGVIQIFCVQLEGSSSPMCDMTVPVVSGVVAVIVVLIIVASVVMVTYLMIKHKRVIPGSVRNEVPLDERAQICDAVLGMYEEISDLGSNKVKGDYQYTQNEAYLEVDSGHRQTGIYNN